MNIEKAREIVESVVEGRKRWGQMFGMGEYSKGQLLDALICFVEADQEKEALVPKEELTLARRQLTAANARYARLEKRAKELEEQLVPDVS